MSMENGFELDFPGDDDNVEVPALSEFPIGEPDAASLDIFGEA
jgi:hypothetical protein